MNFNHIVARALLNPDLPPPDVLRAPRSGSVERRFAVHRNTFVAGMIDSLSAAFPVVAALVGPDFFRWMARAYVLARPPSSPLPLDHALGFPGFIASFEPVAGVAYLVDVARLEAMRLRAFQAEDAPVLDPAELTFLTHAPERLWRAKVRLHPATFWLQSPYALYTVWQAHQVDVVGLDDALAAMDIEQPEGVLVFRPSLDVLVQALPAGGAAFFASLAAAGRLGDAIDRALRESPSADPSELLGLLLSGTAVQFYAQDEDATDAH